MGVILEKIKKEKAGDFSVNIALLSSAWWYGKRVFLDGSERTVDAKNRERKSTQRQRDKVPVLTFTLLRPIQSAQFEPEPYGQVYLQEQAQ